MAIYAHVKDGKVVNTSVWDEVQPYDPGDVLFLKLSDSDEPEAGMPGIGWDYDGETFVDNRPVEEFPQ